MPDDVTPEMLAEARIAFRRAMMASVLSDRPEIDSRTAAAFQKAGLLQDAEQSKIPDDLPDILGNPDDPRRVGLGRGPLLFIAEGPRQRAVVNVADHLVSTRPDVRAAALAHFQHLKREEPGALTPRTKSAAGSAEQAFAAGDVGTWREAGLALLDAVNDDWLCSLAGARQSIRAEFSEGIDVYLTRVMRPTVSSLESIRTGVRAPADEPDQVREALAAIARESSEVREALDSFYETIGHLPLVNGLSLPSLLVIWEEARGKLGDPWSTLWEWANGIDSPLPRYHVCRFFISQPDRIPEGRHAELWHEVVEIADVRQGGDSAHRWTEAWKAFCELGRHYCTHLELQRQGQHGEGVAAFAWWMAKQALALFGTSGEHLKHVRDITIRSELDLSTRTWQLARPLVTPSALRCATLNIAFPWSRAVLSGIGPGLSQMRPEAMSQSDRDCIGATIQGLVVVPWPAKQDAAGSPIYAFERPALDTVRAWIEVETNDERKERLQALASLVAKLSTDEGSEEAFRVAPDGDELNQILVMQALRTRAYTNTAPAKLLWDTLVEEKGRRRLLGMLSVQALELAVDALAEVAAQHGGKWITHLPHFLAIACEEAMGDDDRRDLLFAAVVLSSACFDSVSAIQRLLKGKQGSAMAQAAAYWRARYEEIWGLVPAWLQTRFRGTLAVLPPAQVDDVG